MGQSRPCFYGEVIGFGHFHDRHNERDYCALSSSALSATGEVIVQLVNLQFGPGSRKPGAHFSIESVISQAIVGALGGLIGGGLAKLLVKFFRRAIKFREELAIEASTSEILARTVEPKLNAWISGFSNEKALGTGGAGRLVMK